MKPIYLLLLLTFFSVSTFSQQKIDTQDFLKDFLSADDISSEENIKEFLSNYNEIFLKTKNVVDKEDNVYDKHEVMFEILHDNYLKKYIEESYITRLFTNQEFNCVTSVILYYLLCSDLGLDINLYESPFHIYITVNQPGNKELIIELTDPVDGFDFELDAGDYVDYLLDYKLITQEELDEKGELQIYKEFTSNSKKILHGKLLSIYFGNLASYHLAESETYEAYKKIKKAVIIEPDSLYLLSHNLIWTLHAESLEKDPDSLSFFLLETIDSIPSSKGFQDAMINVSAVAIDNNLRTNNFNMADSIFNKLCSVLTDEYLSVKFITEMEITIESNKIVSKAIRSEFEEAFQLASKLLSKYRDNEKILDIYVNVGRSYIGSLETSADFNKIFEVADTLYSFAPGIKTIEDAYAFSRVGLALKSGLYKTDISKAKQIVTEAYNKLPDNMRLKKAMAMIYHELAMMEIRNRNYNKAISLLKEGLVYDPENYELQYEIQLTTDLLPKK